MTSTSKCTWRNGCPRALDMELDDLMDEVERECACRNHEVVSEAMERTTRSCRHRHNEGKKRKYRTKYNRTVMGLVDRRFHGLTEANKRLDELLDLYIRRDEIAAKLQTFSLDGWRSFAEWKEVEKAIEVVEELGRLRSLIEQACVAISSTEPCLKCAACLNVEKTRKGYPYYGSGRWRFSRG